MTTEHILVIDDEPDIRSLVKEILEDEGFEVSIAENNNVARMVRMLDRIRIGRERCWAPAVGPVRAAGQSPAAGDLTRRASSWSASTVPKRSSCSVQSYRPGGCCVTHMDAGAATEACR